MFKPNRLIFEKFDGPEDESGEEIADAGSAQKRKLALEDSLKNVRILRL